MRPDALVVAGTDTGVGKTAFSAMLALALDAAYWKPVQSGTEDGTDTGRVRAITRLPEERFLKEAYVLRQPLSPHRAAELDSVTLSVERLARLPACRRTLIVETAGGLLTPIARSLAQIELVRAWGAPVVLCARTTLGTINHALLSIEALRRRSLPLLGVAFIGEPNEDSERTICEMGVVRRLGRMPWLDALTPASLARAFEQNFSRADFLQPAGATP